MSKEKFLEYLTLNKETDTLKLRLVMQSAPFLKKVRQSCILVVPFGDGDVLWQELSQTDIHCVMLHRSDRKEIVMLYREGELNRHLEHEEVRRFLTSYGYEGSEVQDYLPLLKKRVASFYKKSMDFPHEIGAFLGYPIEDVKGFIEHAGQEFLLSGYWKVYSDIQRARELFQQFDMAREQAANEFLAGKRLSEIAG